MREAEAAVAIVHAREPEEAVLLMRRAERHGDSWSGQWSCPGGRRDPQDVDLLHTALRELEEECGVRLRIDDLETTMPPRIARRASPPYLLVAPFVFRIGGHLPTVLDSVEAVEAAWVPLSLLRDRSRHLLRPVPGRPAEMCFPAIAWSETPLWGFTYRLLRDWLVPEPAPPHAGFRLANAVLEFLTECGLTLERGWDNHHSTKIAKVRGTFPATAIRERFCSAGEFVDAVNLLEIRPQTIHIVGADYEEYFLESTTAEASQPAS